MQSGIPEIKFISKNTYFLNSIKRIYKYFLIFQIKFPHKVSFLDLDSADDYSIDGSYNLKKLFFELTEKDNESLSKLILIIDLFSLDEYELSILKELIISYPEVKFLFSTASKNDLSNLFFKEVDDNARNKICFYMHSFSLLSKNIIDEFNLILKGKNNLFDASFLRTALKLQKIEKIGFVNNFNNLNKKREENLAYSVDEEKTQNYLMSYALFKYGYRVLPITSYYEIQHITDEIKAINKNIETKNNQSKKNEYKPNLIIRDWDIQFEDYPHSSDPQNDYVNKMRGFYLDKNTKQWSDNNSIWEQFIHTPIFIFSRLSNNNYDENEPTLIEPDKNVKSLWHHQLISDFNNSNKNPKRKPKLIGISKPLDGLSEIEKILLVFAKENSTPINLPFDINCIDRTRANQQGGHSVPPDIYHICENILIRAQKYYDNKKYFYSAILSQEAMEILNGLHNDLHLDAIYLRHLSEVSLETDYLGVESLKNCAQKRFNEVYYEVLRTGNNKKAINNFLSQIFNDIRHIYKEKEQFDAAEEALKVFISINHRLNLSEIVNPLKKFIVKKLKYSKNRNTSNDQLSNKENDQKKNLRPIKNSWFKDFGWILIPYFVATFIIFQLNTNNIENFPIWFSVFNLTILSVFIIIPKLHLTSLIYTLIGRVPSLRFLVISIVLSHFFISYIFYNYINCTKVVKYKNNLEYNIPVNVLYTSFSMQASPDFEKIINSEQDKDIIENTDNSIYSSSINIKMVEKHERYGFLVLLIFHLVLVYFYLGTFISTLYQKLKKE